MKEIKITEQVESKIKRFYLPLVIKTECPKCKANNNIDLDSDYLSYPTTNKREEIDVYCFTCEHEYTKSLTLKISVEIEE